MIVVEAVVSKVGLMRGGILRKNVVGFPVKTEANPDAIEYSQNETDDYIHIPFNESGDVEDYYYDFDSDTFVLKNINNSTIPATIQIDVPFIIDNLPNGCDININGQIHQAVTAGSVEVTIESAEKVLIVIHHLLYNDITVEVDVEN